MVPLPTIRQLSFFVALARRQSFSKAAEDCLVSQSTLSAGVKELEGVMGTSLVDRSARGFALTPLGEQTLIRANDILALSEDMVRAARAAEPMSGAFRLGVIPTIGPFVLPKALPQLRTEYPKLQLYLREDLTANLLERLLAGLLDAILIAFPYDAAGIEHIDIGEDPFLLAAPDGSDVLNRTALTTEDLEGEEILLLEDGHCLRDHALSACRLQAPAAAGAFGATSLFTLVQMADSGLGLTLLPWIAVQAGVAAGTRLQLREFADPAPSRKLGLAWRKGAPRRDEAERIAKCVKNAIDSLAG